MSASEHPAMPLQHAHDRLCIGLTGGIGCGKSTVARLFESHGAGIIDTDAIAHQLTQPDGLAISSIRTAFGADYLTDTGALDRTRMRQLIFSDVNARHKLENILHPQILAISLSRLQTFSQAPYVILMVPLLLENPDFIALVQRVLLVDCTEKKQIERVKQRSQLDETEIRAIIAQQVPSEIRIARADDIIQNDGTRDELANQVAAMHNCYLRLGHENTI
ncbi:MAG: dephospho-CoA kinase [Gallionella sp.]|nr:dephospho-CoA kinase [Gallionella sp.]